jgi:hypothetical protein
MRVGVTDVSPYTHPVAAKFVSSLTCLTRLLTHFLEVSVQFIELIFNSRLHDVPERVTNRHHALGAQPLGNSNNRVYRY